MSGDTELMIAQEQGAICKKGLVKSLQGTLVLTNQRLIFACGNENIDSFAEQTDAQESLSQKISTGVKNAALDIQAEGGVLAYADVESLSSIPASPYNLFISLDTIRSATGHGAVAGMPKLKVSWREDRGEKEAEFEQTLTGPGRKKLSAWAELITGLKNGTVKLHPTPVLPGRDSLEGKIAYVMSDLQEKGLFEIEEQVESQFKIDADPDQVQSACENLVAQGILLKDKDSTGDGFYRKKTPLE